MGKTLKWYCTFPPECITDTILTAFARVAVSAAFAVGSIGLERYGEIPAFLLEYKTGAAAVEPPDEPKGIGDKQSEIQRLQILLVLRLASSYRMRSGQLPWRRRNRIATFFI